MKRSVRVRIESRQADGTHIRKASGELYVKGDACYLRYAERDEALGAMTTTVRWDAEEIRIIRRGSIESEQTFRANKTTAGKYALPQGRAELECKTGEIEDRTSGGIGTLSWSYDLYMDGMHAGRLGLKLSIEEELTQ